MCICWPRLPKLRDHLRELVKARKTWACEAERHHGRYRYNGVQTSTGRRYRREGVPQVVKKENQKKSDAEEEAKEEDVCMKLKVLESIGQTKKQKAERESPEMTLNRFCDFDSCKWNQIYSNPKKRARNIFPIFRYPPIIWFQTPLGLNHHKKGKQGSD